MKSYKDSAIISPPIPMECLPAGKTLRLGVLASGNGSNFEAIAQAIKNKHLNAEIPILIYNNPDAQVVERAQKYQVPTYLINHRDYQGDRQKFDGKVIDVLREHQVDWVIMAGWMRIATPVLVKAFPQRIINIHPSLLPSFPGINAIEQALQAGVKVTGCTVHLVVEEVDSGPIIMQAVVPILPKDTPETLHARVQIQEHKIMVGAIALATSQMSINLE